MTEEKDKLLTFLRFFINYDDGVGRAALAGHRMLPNIITICALSTGLTAIRFAMDGRWGVSISLILVAAVLDTMDGAMARLLKATSAFGAQLDSLADFVSFGVAPALILYFWALSDAGTIGWISSLLLCVACALRLARFNARQIIADQMKQQAVVAPVVAEVSPPLPHPDAQPVAAKAVYFEGVPSPAGAILSLFPMFVSFLFGAESPAVSPLIGIWVLMVAALMVSRLPTFSVKKVRISARHTIPVLGLVALVLAAVTSQPWLTLTLVCMAYIGSLPLSLQRYKRDFLQNDPMFVVYKKPSADEAAVAGDNQPVNTAIPEPAAAKVATKLGKAVSGRGRKGSKVKS
jgi:CDP-diacylglycerol--serine O-phosphatidyltransferase